MATKRLISSEILCYKEHLKSVVYFYTKIRTTNKSAVWQSSLYYGVSRW